MAPRAVAGRWRPSSWRPAGRWRPRSVAGGAMEAETRGVKRSPGAWRSAGPSAGSPLPPPSRGGPRFPGLREAAPPSRRIEGSCRCQGCLALLRLSPRFEGLFPPDRLAELENKTGRKKAPEVSGKRSKPVKRLLCSAFGTARRQVTAKAPRPLPATCCQRDPFPLRQAFAAPAAAPGTALRAAGASEG